MLKSRYSAGDIVRHEVNFNETLARYYLLLKPLIIDDLTVVIFGDERWKYYDLITCRIQIGLFDIGFKKIS